MGLWGMHISGRRNIGIFLDPILACNLRCRMCYFSDDTKRSEMKGIINEERLDKIEKSLFHRALKLQIGCGAEPTLYAGLLDLIRRGKHANIPYISLTTNGQLLVNGRVSLMQLVEAGLNELTLSMHGTNRETYEYLMTGSSFDHLLALLNDIAKVKRVYPKFVLRVNFTINSMNINNLSEDRFWALWQMGGEPDIVQMRPVQNIGNSLWQDFDLTPIKTHYEATIVNVANECKRRGITCYYPTSHNIDAVDNHQDSTSSIIEELTYCYVSPSACYFEDFDLNRDTYETYHKRKHTSRKLLLAALTRGSSQKRNVSKKLNYHIK